jgi:creatinase
MWAATRSATPSPKGVREIDVAMAGRDAMELEIARRFPDAEYRDTWVWFQSGINTDGAHNPVTARQLQRGDILSLNTFPMISGYYTALERTLFVGEVDDAAARSGRPTSPRTNWACRC